MLSVRAQEELHLSHKDHPIMATNNADPETQSIPQLIFSLKSSFRSGDFERTQGVLMAREQKLKRQLAAREQEIDSLRADRSVKIHIEEEVEGHKSECLKLKEERNESLAMIREDKQLIVELRRKICDLESAKLRAESETAVYKTKFEELEARTLFLEKEFSRLLDDGQRKGGIVVSHCEAGEKERCEREAIDCGNEGPGCHSPDFKGTDAKHRSGLGNGTVSGEGSGEKAFGENENVGDVKAGLCASDGSRTPVSVASLSKSENADCNGNLVNGSAAKKCVSEVAKVSEEGFGDNAVMTKDSGEIVGSSVKSEGSGKVRGENLCLEQKQIPDCQLPEAGTGDKVTPGTVGPADIVEIGDSDDESSSCEILEVKETTSQLLVGDALSGQEHGDMGSVLQKRKRATLDTTGRNDKADEIRDDENSDDDIPGSKLKIMKHEEVTNDSSPAINCFSIPMSSENKETKKFLSQSRQDTAILKPCGGRMMVPRIFGNLMNETDFGARLADTGDDDSSSSSDSEDSDYLVGYCSIIANDPANRGHKRWESEADMVEDLKKDGELCMKAVCALYRQQTSSGKLFRGPSAPQGRGFNMVDRFRGTTLAEFLVNGDPLGRLHKSIKELAAYDGKGLDDCKRLATEHSSQLFEISQQENFFLD